MIFRIQSSCFFVVPAAEIKPANMLMMNYDELDIDFGHAMPGYARHRVRYLKCALDFRMVLIGQEALHQSVQRKGDNTMCQAENAHIN